MTQSDELLKTSGLTLEGDVWRSSQTGSAVDYPDEGNAFCYQVEDASFWFRHRNDVILQAVGRFPPTGPIVDVGSGNGFVARALQHAGFSTIALEPGAQGSANARARGVGSVVCSTLEGARFLPGSLPAAGVFDVLEHVADDAGFLRLLQTLLSPDGLLYVTVPAYQALWSSEDDLSGHHRRYTRGRLHAAVIRAGFEVLYDTYLFTLFPVPIFLLRRVPYLLGRRSRPDVQAIRNRLQPKENLLTRGLDAVLAAERRWLGKSRTLPFGSSVLLVARKRRGPAWPRLGPA